MWWCTSEVLEEESWVTRGHSITEVNQRGYGPEGTSVPHAWWLNLEMCKSVTSIVLGLKR